MIIDISIPEDNEEIKLERLRLHACPGCGGTILADSSAVLVTRSSSVSYDGKVHLKETRRIAAAYEYNCGTVVVIINKETGLVKRSPKCKILTDIYACADDVI